MASRVRALNDVLDIVERVYNEVGMELMTALNEPPDDMEDDGY